MDAISGVLSEARDFLPFSDARKGPLSDLAASGAAFLNTFREGFAPAEQQLQARVVAIVGDVKATLGIPDVQVSNAPALAPNVQVANARTDADVSTNPGNASALTNGLLEGTELWAT